MHKIPKKCPHCGSIISRREISIYRGLIFALAKVYKTCKKDGTHEFEMKDIKHLLGHNNYARFGDLVMFGGLVYKRGRAKYGLNMERCEDFFAGRTTMPTRILKDPVSKQIEVIEYKDITGIDDLVKFLDESGLYAPKYEDMTAPRQEQINFDLQQ